RGAAARRPAAVELRDRTRPVGLAGHRALPPAQCLSQARRARTRRRRPQGARVGCIRGTRGRARVGEQAPGRVGVPPDPHRVAAGHLHRAIEGTTRGRDVPREGRCSMRIRWTFGLLFAVAALFVVVMPAAAGKTDNHDSLNPQGANIPYLAWVGENVKLVRAFHWATDFPSIADHSGDGFAAELAVVEWTGDQNYKPYVIGGTLDASTHHYHGPFLEIRGGELTAQGDVVDTHPGIAKIKLFVTYKGDLVKEQTFEVAWMTLVKPTLHEMSNADLAELSDKPMSLGDPAGDGKFVPM